MTKLFFKYGDDLLFGIVHTSRMVADLGIIKQIPYAPGIPPDDIFCRDVMSAFQNPMTNSLRGKLGIGDIEVKQRDDPARFAPFDDTGQIGAPRKRGFEGKIIP